MPLSLSSAWGVFPQIGHLETVNVKDVNPLGILPPLPFSPPSLLPSILQNNIYCMPSVYQALGWVLRIQMDKAKI